jgi:hypothetical protein
MKEIYQHFIFSLQISASLFKNFPFIYFYLLEWTDVNFIRNLKSNLNSKSWSDFESHFNKYNRNKTNLPRKKKEGSSSFVFKCFPSSVSPHALELTWVTLSQSLISEKMEEKWQNHCSLYENKKLVLDRWCLIPGISGGSAHVIKPVVM